MKRASPRRRPEADIHEAANDKDKGMTSPPEANLLVHYEDFRAGAVLARKKAVNLSHRVQA